MNWIDKLVSLNACGEAVAWCRTRNSLADAWKHCTRGDWMLWLIGKTDRSLPWSEERKPIVRIAVECAMLAPSCQDEYELARQWCLDATLRWCDGTTDIEEVYAARAAAFAAYAADAANAAAYAAYARKRVWSDAADIVREHFPTPPEL